VFRSDTLLNMVNVFEKPGKDLWPGGGKKKKGGGEGLNAIIRAPFGKTHLRNSV